MFEDASKRRQAAKWVIGVATACIGIYLAIRHIGVLANAVAYLIEISRPLWIGVITAMILNVPMSAVEDLLCRKCKRPASRGARRTLAIVLALVLVLGLFIGIAFLVIPELVNAVTLIIQIAMNSVDQMAQLDQALDYSSIPLGEYLAQLNIDWAGLKLQLEQWFQSQGSVLADVALNAAKTFASEIVTVFIALVFSIYILSKKETLKKQACRLVRVWLPQRVGPVLTHIASTCSRTFHLFIAGQATEAIILGTLCVIGMLILRLPYAPMIGALVGVTALIPLVGAYVGAIVGAIMILTVDPFKAVVFLIFLVILQQVEGNVIYPRVVGTKIKLPAMWVLAAVTIGGNLAGPLGLLLGVPAASAAYSLLREATELREQKRNR